MKYRAMAAAILALTTLQGHALVAGVYENRNEPGRTGANLNETILTTQNVNAQQFGRLFTAPVDGIMFAQPLYVGKVGAHNLVLVATMEDSVYAFDADTGVQVWHTSFQNPAAGITSIPISDIVNPVEGDINAGYDVGIEGTPVIDAQTNTMYLVTRTKEITNGVVSYAQRFRALSIATGAEVTGSGQKITASYGGVTFNPLVQNQRPGLALSNGQIIVCWGSHQDFNTYHGWIMSFDKSSLKQTGAFATTTTAQGAAVWQAGRAPVVLPGGDVVVYTGNGLGSVAGYDGKVNFSETALRLRPSANGLTVVDWFTPANWAALDSGDLDLSSSGPTLLPASGTLIGGGKDGTTYVLNSASMGKRSNSGVIQSFATGGEQHTGMVMWDRRANGSALLMYGSAPGLPIKSWAWMGNAVNTTPVAQTQGSSGMSFPGSVMSLSANSGNSGTGILWSLSSSSGDSGHDIRYGTLRAFNAENLSLLWSSSDNKTDEFGMFSKFTPPTVANGKVYVATFANALVAYGVLPTPRPMPTQANYVKIVSRNDPNMVLEVAGASRANLSRIQIGPDSGWGRQRWRLSTNANGTVQLHSALSDTMVLDVPNASQVAGTALDLYSNNGSNAQNWTLRKNPNGNGYYQFVSALNANLVLDLWQANTAAGNVVDTYTVNGTAAQDWSVIAEPDTGEPECGTQVLLESRLAAGKVLTLPVGASNGTSTQLATWSNSNTGQKWTMSTNLDGSYSFQSALTAGFLDLSGGANAPGTKVQSYTGNGTNAQRWVIADTNNTFWNLTNKAATNLSLDVSGGNAADGTQVWGYTTNGTAAQDWRIRDAVGLFNCRFRSP